MVHYVLRTEARYAFCLSVDMLVFKDTLVSMIMEKQTMKAPFNFDNTYARDLEGFYVPWKGAEVPAPKLEKLNIKLAEELGLDVDYLQSPEGVAVLTGTHAPEGSESLAMVYAGHQFGGFSPQLGDGRALLIGEIIDTAGQRRDLQLKGSGRTPFSRGGDGKAVLGPVLREYLIAEAMHALGIPTTRALAAVTTGEQIRRNGFEPGAVLTRVAASHLRIGTFQFFAARGDTEKVRTLADYAIERHYPELKELDNKYLSLLAKVIDVQSRLVAKWVSVGFVHGVMNTDNTTISGETIDYGPCAFIDHYDPNAVFSSIDHQGRYAYMNQAAILQWNLTRFAETLLQLIEPDDTDKAIELATKELEAMSSKYESYWLNEMRSKLGLGALQEEDSAVQDSDKELVHSLFELLKNDRVDYTQFFRTLAKAAQGEVEQVQSLFTAPEEFNVWLKNWQQRIENSQVNADAIATQMNLVNPIYIPRNHKVEFALQEASEQGNLEPFNELLELLTQPYTEVSGKEDFASPPPAGTPQCVTYCGT